MTNTTDLAADRERIAETVRNWPHSDMHIGQLEDFMDHADARVRKAALQAAYCKGQLVGMNDLAAAIRPLAGSKGASPCAS